MSNERIVYTNQDGSVSVVIPSGEVPIETIMTKDVPANAINARQITTDELPQDRLFRGAWDDSNPEEFIGINLSKAKEIAHTIRRAKREEEFKPLDEVIMKQIPGTHTVTAEESRAEIRNRYTQIQNDIDSTTDETSLRSTLINNNII